MVDSEATPDQVISRFRGEAAANLPAEGESSSFLTDEVDLKPKKRGKGSNLIHKKRQKLRS